MKNVFICYPGEEAKKPVLLSIKHLPNSPEENSSRQKSRRKSSLGLDTESRENRSNRGRAGPIFKGRVSLLVKNHSVAGVLAIAKSTLT